eukprot:g15511.t1
MERVKFFCGCLPLVVFGWYAAVNIIISTSWDFLDRKVFGLIARIQRFAREFDSARFGLPPPRDAENDQFLWPTFFWLAVVLPAWFFYELTLASLYGVNYWRILVYNAVRLGPMYCNFMYVYVLAHKEAHLYLRHENSYLDVYCTAYRPRDSFANFVKYIPAWAGFASNVTTIYQWLFSGGPGGEEKNKYQKKTFQMVLWTLYYLGFIFMCCKWQKLLLFVSNLAATAGEQEPPTSTELYYSGQVVSINPFPALSDSFIFTFWTLIFAFVEAGLLLAIVNWVWHGFIDIRDPASPYVNSTTVVEGLNFTLAEDMKEPAMYPGVHWSNHLPMYEKHLQNGGYHNRKLVEEPAASISNSKSKNERLDVLPATGFYKENLFEIFGMMVGQDYEKLARIFYKPFIENLGPKSESLTQAEVADLMKRRMRYHGPIAALRVGNVKIDQETLEKDYAKFEADLGVAGKIMTE